MYAPAERYVPQCTAPGEATRKGALVIWGTLSAITLILMALIIAAPLASAHGYDALASTIYQAFSPFCHQISERSFHIAGHKLAVCSRCTGIYAGVLAGVLLYPLARSLGRRGAPSPVWLILSSVPITLDFALGFFGIWRNTHTSRLLTGALLGIACAIYLVPGLIDLRRMIYRRAAIKSDRGAG